MAEEPAHEEESKEPKPTEEESEAKEKSAQEASADDAAKPEDEEATVKKIGVSSFDGEPEDEAGEQSEATMATKAGDSDNEEDEVLSKYMLLDRLFKFINTSDSEPLNSVLAGYFNKVVTLLLNRKQKQIVPYIISDEKKVIESLLRHVYSRSIAEVIDRILHIVESNFEEEISQKILEKKQMIISSLIDQLKTQNGDETEMNAAFIL